MKNLLNTIAARLGYVTIESYSRAVAAQSRAERRASAAESRLADFSHRAAFGQSRRVGSVERDIDYATGERRLSGTYALRPPAFSL